MTTTCQICGRAIQAKTGVIAHHGYRRPQGWHAQTRSCFGARFVPYEVGHDALDRYIPTLEDWLERVVAHRAAMIADPPAELEVQKRYAGRVTGTIKLARPEGFEPARHAEAGSYRSGTYEGEFTRICGDRRREISGLTEEIAFLRERRAAWKAVA